MKKLITPYFYNLIHPLDIIQQLKKDRVKLIARVFLVAIGFILSGTLLSHYNQIDFKNLTLGAINIQIISTILSGYGGWKMGDAVKSWLYFYKKTDHKTTHDLWILLRTPFVTENEPLKNYIHQTILDNQRVTIAELDILLEYIDRSLDESIHINNDPFIQYIY